MGVAHASFTGCGRESTMCANASSKGHRLLMLSLISTTSFGAFAMCRWRDRAIAKDSSGYCIIHRHFRLIRG